MLGAILCPIFVEGFGRGSLGAVDGTMAWALLLQICCQTCMLWPKDGKEGKMKNHPIFQHSGRLFFVGAIFECCYPHLSVGVMRNAWTYPHAWTSLCCSLHDRFLGRTTPSKQARLQFCRSLPNIFSSHCVEKPRTKTWFCYAKCNCRFYK